MISVCAAVYRAHPAPNLTTMGAEMEAALAGQDGELVVALNGIDTQSAGMPTWARAVELERNLGVAPGWNAAAKAAGGDVLVFSNDDVELGPGSLSKLASVLRENPGAGVVGPVGSHWDLQRGEHRAWALPDEGATAREGLAECEVVSGFLFACRKSDWEAVGGFDELYAPASWEEVDFCTAVRARGGRCYAVAGVPCGHEWGVSRRQLPWARARWNGRSETWRSIHRRNRRHFLAKWADHPIASIPSDTIDGR